MSPDDPRHGTTAGNTAHRRQGEKPCEACAQAEYRYAKARKLDVLRGQPRLLPAIGFQRRVQALQAIGWQMAEIAEMLDVSIGLLSIRAYRSAWISRENHNRMVEVYDNVCMTPRPNPSSRTIINARRKGFAPPLAWDSDTIDDPAASPKGMDNGFRNVSSLHAEADPVVIERILGGEGDVPANLAERAEVARLWPGSLNELARLTGWKVERYHVRGDVA